MNDFQSILGHEVVTDLLHIATRQDYFNNQEDLLKRATEKLIGGKGGQEKGLSKCRLNKLLNPNSESIIKWTRLDVAALPVTMQVQEINDQDIIVK